ncbi:hypothetical protein [Helicobacter ganmani]|uniref:hypothetical protein n=1 Tax=Helicobacter ganmani TaxID=60246 RepID=UPI003A890A6C
MHICKKPTESQRFYLCTCDFLCDSFLALAASCACDDFYPYGDSLCVLYLIVFIPRKGEVKFHKILTNS